MNNTNIFDIYVSDKQDDILVGFLYVENIKGKNIYSFQFDDNYLSSKKHLIIDPELCHINGKQYKSNSSKIYKFLEDCIPDRWGKNLLKRKEQLQSSCESRLPRQLDDIDYLFGINDYSRQGSIRIAKHDKREFLGEGGKNSIPSIIFINKLENIAYNLDSINDKEIVDLFSPGSSLGGARPKACVFNNNELYIAKFGHKNDDYDVSSVEKLTNDLASLCGINVPESMLLKSNKKNCSIFLVKRFDRNKDERFYYSSCMTLLNASDGESSDYSYLDILELISMYSSTPKKDKFELFKRIAFNILMHNGDDHLRNHAFLRKGKEFSLSPVFDLNPSFDANHLTLSIDGYDYSFNMNSLISVSPYFDIELDDANKIISDMKKICINNIDNLASKYNVNQSIVKTLKNFIRN